MNRSGFIIFLTIVISVYTGIHYFVYRKLVTGLNIQQTHLWYFRIIYIILSFSFIISEFSKRLFPSHILTFSAGLWLGVIITGFIVFLLRDIIKIFLPVNLKLSTYISIGFISLIVIYSAINAALPPKLKKINLNIPNWPQDKKGFSIVQITDLHIGTLTRPEKLKKLVPGITSLDPDLIVITGDFIDEDVSSSKEFHDAVTGLKAKHGIYAITGNHEFFVGVEKFKEICRKSGITLLQNRKTTVDNFLELAGVDDPTITRMGGKKPDLEKIIKSCSPKNPIILLSHQPLEFEKAVEYGVSLQLSGHVHAGQIIPAFPITFLIFKYAFGLYEYKNSYIYTSSGTGIWGIPMRFGSQSEFVQFIIN